jgi:hypothetical protein
MHCDKCKTVIDVAVMIMLNINNEPKHYCKKCFSWEFLNDDKKTTNVI